MDIVYYVGSRIKMIFDGIWKYSKRILLHYVGKVSKFTNVMLLFAATSISVIGVIASFEAGRELLSLQEHNVDLLDLIELIIGDFVLRLGNHLGFIGIMAALVATVGIFVTKLGIGYVPYICMAVNAFELMLEIRRVAQIFVPYKFLADIIQNCFKSL